MASATEQRHPLLAGWQPTEEEMQLYRRAFVAACGAGGAGQLAGGQAVAFFSQSGLPMAQLKQVRRPLHAAIVQFKM